VGAPLPPGQASLRPAAPRRAPPLRPSCLITGVAPARDSGWTTARPATPGGPASAASTPRAAGGGKEAPEAGPWAGRPAGRSGLARQPACQPWASHRRYPWLTHQPRGWPAPGTRHRLDRSPRLVGAPERPVLHIQDRATRSTAGAPERRILNPSATSHVAICDGRCRRPEPAAHNGSGSVGFDHTEPRSCPAVRCTSAAARICRSSRAGAAAKLAPSMVTPRRLAAGRLLHPS
jgi:hypothetical protein